MTQVGKLEPWFAWHPVIVYGKTYWWRWLYRRRVNVPEAFGYGFWGSASGWQYRLFPED